MTASRIDESFLRVEIDIRAHLDGLCCYDKYRLVQVSVAPGPDAGQPIPQYPVSVHRSNTAYQ